MANVAGRERWAFIADWTDPGSGVRWTYQLFAYLPEQDAAEAVEIEMVGWPGASMGAVFLAGWLLTCCMHQRAQHPQVHAAAATH